MLQFKPGFFASSSSLLGNTDFVQAHTSLDKAQTHAEITIVVTFKNLSAYEGTPPEEGKSRKIADGPLYSLAEIQALSEQPDTVMLWTRRCVDKAADLGFDASGVGGLFRELSKQDYRDSEWCENGKGGVAACDAYTLSRVERIEATNKLSRIVYFLKFALSKTGKLVLMVSCHTSN